MLESENQYLKRFAPPDILSNLSNLVQNKMPHPVHKAESMLSDPQSRNLSPAPSEHDELPNVSFFFFFDFETYTKILFSRQFLLIIQINNIHVKL